MRGFAERCANEVVELHEHFVALFTAQRDATTVERCLARFAPPFVRVAPDGTLQDRAELGAMLGEANGRVEPDFAIAIDVEAAEPLGERAAVVRYIETQSARGRQTKRRSTAVFVAAADGAPRWFALQETWIE